MNPRESMLASRMDAQRQRPRPRNLQRAPDGDEPAFPIALRGYDRQAVDDYVERVSSYVADLKMTHSKQDAVREALDQVADETSGILQHAHETAEGVSSRARSEASQRVQEAEREARQTRANAEAHARALAQDTDNVWQERSALLEEMRGLAESLLEIADSAAERLPELSALPAMNGTAESFTGAAGSRRSEVVPPPPPPPGAETRNPPPPPPEDLTREQAPGAFADDPIAEDDEDGPIVDDHDAEATGGGWDEPPTAGGRSDAWAPDHRGVEDAEADEGFTRDEADEPPSPNRPNQRFVSGTGIDRQRFVPPPDRAGGIDTPTQAMDALPADVDEPRGGLRAFKGPGFSVRWRG